MPGFSLESLVEDFDGDLDCTGLDIDPGVDQLDFSVEDGSLQ